jgi:hypothetical protein
MIFHVFPSGITIGDLSGYILPYSAGLLLYKRVYKKDGAL